MGAYDAKPVRFRYARCGIYHISGRRIAISGLQYEYSMAAIMTLTDAPVDARMGILSSTISDDISGRHARARRFFLQQIEGDGIELPENTIRREFTAR